MTKVTEIFSLEELAENIDEGFVRDQLHPEFPELRLLNYTEKTQFARQWNAVTRACRGLIYNTETNEIVARPFPKIHNWNEESAPVLPKKYAPVFSWSNKEDGSLGIAYRAPDETIRVATRGSFSSEQALHATEKLNEGDTQIWDTYLDSGFTPLFEIVYPENRIVLDYGDMDGLFFLGAMKKQTGVYVPDPSIERTTRTIDELLRDTERPNAEGWVIWLTPLTAIKVKQADYVELHRIVTNLNRKSVWRALKDNTMDELLEIVPDELYTWVTEVQEELQDTFDKLLDEAVMYMEACGGFEGSQKDFALRVQKDVPSLARGWVFALRSNNNRIDESIWRAIEPKGNER